MSDTAEALEAEAAYGGGQATSAEGEAAPGMQALLAGQATAAAESVVPKQRRRAGAKQRSKKLAKVCISCRLNGLIEWLCSVCVLD